MHASRQRESPIDKRSRRAKPVRFPHQIMRSPGLRHRAVCAFVITRPSRYFSFSVCDSLQRSGSFRPFLAGVRKDRGGQFIILDFAGRKLILAIKRSLAARSLIKFRATRNFVT
jgi:hypothetical protein